MAVKTVTGKVTGPDGSNKVAAITITLSQPCTIPGTQETVPSVVKTTSLADGTYSVSLQANNDLTPNGTFYTVTESTLDGGFYSFTIVVPQTAGPFVMSNIMTNAPTASPSPSHLSSLTVDGATIHPPQTPTEAVLVSGIDASLSEEILITLTASRVMGVPLNGVAGQHLHMVITEGGAGGFALTFGAGITVTNFGLNMGVGSKTDAYLTCISAGQWVVWSPSVSGQDITPRSVTVSTSPYTPDPLAASGGQSIAGLSLHKAQTVLQGFVQMMFGDGSGGGTASPGLVIGGTNGQWVLDIDVAQPIGNRDLTFSRVLSQRTISDGVTTLGSPIITSATAAFVSGDVGREVRGVGIPTGLVVLGPGTTIASVTNGTTAVLSANATASGTALYMEFGTLPRSVEDILYFASKGVNSCITYLGLNDLTVGGARVVLIGPGNASDPGIGALLIKNGLNQTGDALLVQNGGGGNLFRIDSIGHATLGQRGLDLSYPGSLSWGGGDSAAYRVWFNSGATAAAGGSNSARVMVIAGGTLAAGGNSDTLSQLEIASGTYAIGAFTGIAAYGIKITGSGFSKTGGGTIPGAYGLWIDGPTIGTANYAIYVPTGISRFDGLVDINQSIALGGGAAPTLGTIGGTGPATAAQNSWLKINIGTVASYIPVWR